MRLVQLSYLSESVEAESWGKVMCVKEQKNSYNKYAIAAKVKLPSQLVPVIVGHLPKEISRIDFFTISRGEVVN